MRDRPYRLVVFDFDGTLADSFPFFLDALDTLADRHGFARIERTQLDSLRELDARRLLKHLGLPLWKVPQVGRHLRQMMAEHTNDIRLFDGIDPMLRQLHASGVQLALLTSNSERNVRAVLGPHLSGLFSRFLCGSGLFGKRDKLRRLLALGGVARHEVLCIGDEVRDLEAAHAEKLDFGAVAWGYTSPLALRSHDPAWLFEHPAAICAALGT